ncbi:hypothetical protein [Protaetiibacter intestinalis]|uniref:Uncharacterized protein n=1 Tax=Protaetiibacter intestinalis TaxID=2419774 RepID=A0A387BC15_9MICO|nr:hypothetical protein [Protaetiibacter intestinalis]AYF98635.1 hypothetical protein D7I47_10430 [Protaetiibacter intestinalis]
MRSRSPRSGLRYRLAALLGAVIALTLIGNVSAQAFWSATTTATGTVRVADPAVTLIGYADLTKSYTSASLGPYVASLSIQATGSGPVTLSISTTTTNAALAGQISLSLWVRSGGSCGTSGSGATTGTLAAPPALPTGATSLAAPGSVVVCAATTFTGSSATYGGQSTTVTLKLTGTTTGSTWTASASGAFTQDVGGSIANCAEADGNYNAIISWSNPAGVPTSTQYRVSVVPLGGGSVIEVQGSPSYWSTMQYVGSSLFSTAGSFRVQVRMYTDSSLAGPGTIIATRDVTVTPNQWHSSMLIFCA